MKGYRGWDAVYRGLAIRLVTAPSDEARLRRAYLRFVAMLEAD